MIVFIIPAAIGLGLGIILGMSIGFTKFEAKLAMQKSFILNGVRYRVVAEEVDYGDMLPLDSDLDLFND